jgi:Sec-independent protein secretion pathway component TatC
VASQIALALVLMALYELSILLTSRNLFGLKKEIPEKSREPAGDKS